MRDLRVYQTSVKDRWQTLQYINRVWKKKWEDYTISKCVKDGRQIYDVSKEYEKQMINFKCGWMPDCTYGCLYANLSAITWTVVWVCGNEHCLLVIFQHHQRTVYKGSERNSSFIKLKPLATQDMQTVGRLVLSTLLSATTRRDRKSCTQLRSEEIGNHTSRSDLKRPEISDQKKPEDTNPARQTQLIS